MTSPTGFRETLLAHAKWPETLATEQRLLGLIIRSETARANDPTGPDLMTAVGASALTRCFSAKGTRALWRLLCERQQRGEPNTLVAVSEAALDENLDAHFAGSPGIGSALAAWVERVWQYGEDSFLHLAAAYAAELEDAADRTDKIVLLTDTLVRLVEDPRRLSLWWPEQIATLPNLTLPDAGCLMRLADSMSETLGSIADLAKAGRARISDIVTGISRLDLLMGGLLPGKLYAVGARPGMGKTAFAVNVVRESIARRRQVAFFSLEMSADEVIRRLISQLTGIELSRLIRGPLRVDDHALAVAAAQQLTETITVLDDKHTKWPEIMVQCHRLAANKQLDLVVIDYLGLLTTTTRKTERWEVVGEITREAKLLARRLNVPLMLLVQLNREAEGKRPGLYHLRESGNIEQDADAVILLNRAGKNGIGNSDRSAEIILAKNRQGPCADIACEWVGPCALFRDFDAYGDSTSEQEP